MQPLTITQTEATPYVCLDNLQGTIHIKGNSYDEDAFTFYTPVLQWLDQYKQYPKKETILTIELKYFNTSSAKCLYEVLDRLADIRSSQAIVTVNWYYNKRDLEMKQEIQAFSQLVELPFNIHEQT
jgi:hypothetical protein